MSGSIGSISTASGIDGKKLADDIKTPGGLFVSRKTKNKVKAAKAEVLKAGDKTNTNVDKTNNDGKKNYSISTENNDNANYELTEGLDDQAETEDTSAVAVVEQGEANTDAVSIQAAADLALANTAAIQEMQTNCEAGKEEVMAQITEALDGMNEAGALLMANFSEAEGLGAELEGLTADEGGSAGGFSTSMAAAGGQNSAYGLNIPTGNNKPVNTGKAGKGGLISGGTQTQGANQGSYAPSAPNTGDDSAKVARTQEIYARLAEIETQNIELMTSISTYADLATELQVAYVEDTETNVVANAEASNEQATQGSADAQASGQAFAKITEYGNYTKLAGVATQAVGVGMTVAGSTVQVAGTGVKAAGGVMKGLGAGLQSLGASLLPGVFTAPAGSAVTGAGIGVNAAGSTTIAVGNTVTTVGKGLGQAGMTTQKVGKATQAVGNATVAVGSAGTAVTNVANGNWLGAIASGLSCIGSAASCIGDTAQFAAMVDQGRGEFLSGLQNFNTKMNGWMSKAMGKGDVATNKTVATGNFQASGSLMDGNFKLAQETVNTTVLVGNTATQGFTQAATALNQYAGTADQDGGAAVTTDTTGTTAQVDDKSLTYKAAKTYGLSTSAIEGKSDAEIQQMIRDFHAGKIEADGTPKKES